MPPNKKAKKTENSDSESESKSSSSSSDESTPRKEAKPKQGDGTKSKSSSADSSKPKDNKRVAGESEPTWELGGKKFIKIREFKGKTYVDIREYYEKDGKVLPTKKGASLNIEQWQIVCSTIDEVNKVLSK